MVPRIYFRRVAPRQIWDNVSSASSLARIAARIAYICTCIDLLSTRCPRHTGEINRAWKENTTCHVLRRVHQDFTIRSWKRYHPMKFEVGGNREEFLPMWNFNRGENAKIINILRNLFMNYFRGFSYTFLFSKLLD